MIFLPFYEDVMYQLNRSFNISPPPPTPGILWAFDTFAILGRREFDYQSLSGVGEFEPLASILKIESPEM